MKDLCDRQLPTCRHRRIKNSAFRLCVATAFLSAIGSLGYTLPLCAATPAAGTTITNQATGSFVDELDSSNTETPVQSNICDCDGGGSCGDYGNGI